MTEKDLFRYLKAKARENRLSQDLKALEAIYYAPSSPTISALPPSHNNSGDKYSANAEKLDKLRRALNAVVIECNAYYLALERAEEALTTPEQSLLFDLLYRKGKDIKESAPIIGYSLGHTYRIRQNILALVSSVPA